MDHTAAKQCTTRALRRSRGQMFSAGHCPMIDMTMSRAVKALHITGRRALPRRTLSLSPLVATARLQMHALRLIGCEHGLLAPLGHASLAGISCVASETAALGARNRVHAAHQPLGPAAGATWLSTSPGLPEMSGLACSRRAARTLSDKEISRPRGKRETRSARPLGCASYPPRQGFGTAGWQ